MFSRDFSKYLMSVAILNQLCVLNGWLRVGLKQEKVLFSDTSAHPFPVADLGRGVFIRSH